MGARAMRRMVCDRFVWSGMARYIILWAGTCVACQRAEITQHIVAPLMPLPMPAKRFDSLHVDLVCPLPESPLDDSGSVHALAGSHSPE